MSAAVEATRPTGFWIAVPEGWVSLDVDPATAAGSAARLLDLAGLGVDERFRGHRADAERLLAQLASAAAAGGVTFAACLVTVVDDVLPVQATLTISVNALDGGGNRTGEVRAALAAADRERAVEVVELDAGPAVRRAGRLRGAAPGTEEQLTLVSRQFYVPVPGTGREVAVLSFSSPTLELEAELSELFDGMAGTFAFTW